jgi:hypothetical protein
MSPKVIWFCRGFEDPLGFDRILREALEAVPPELLGGLESVVLRDLASLGREERSTRFVSRGGRRKKTLSQAKGLYYSADGARSARIELFLDNILEERPRWFFRIPMIREYLVAGVLFHEVGHHIQAAVKPSREEKEDVAQRWKADLFRRYAAQKWLVARLLAAAGRWARGIRRWWRGTVRVH